MTSQQIIRTHFHEYDLTLLKSRELTSEELLRTKIFVHKYGASEEDVKSMIRCGFAFDEIVSVAKKNIFLSESHTELLSLVICF